MATASTGTIVVGSTDVEQLIGRHRSKFTEHTFKFHPDSSGDAVVLAKGIHGKLVELVIIPVDVDMSASWDLEITDEEGVVLYTSTTLSETTATIVKQAGLSFNYNSQDLTFTGVNMGSASAIAGIRMVTEE